MMKIEQQYWNSTKKRIERLNVQQKMTKMFLEGKATEAQEAAVAGDYRSLYKITREDHTKRKLLL